jgi:hypothetical protein
MICSFSICHGILKSGETLDYKERNGIEIIAIGDENETTMATPTILLSIYLIYIHGEKFISRLYDVLQFYGSQYYQGYKSDGSTIGNDLQYLFTVNKDDLLRYPQNVFKLYSRNEKILNLHLGNNILNETLVMEGIYSQYTCSSIDQIVSTDLNHIEVQESINNRNETEVKVALPFGVYSINGPKTMRFIERYSTQLVELKDVLNYIHTTKPVGKKMLFMISCKNYDKNIMMDIQTKLHPLQKTIQKGFLHLFQGLKI